MITVTKPLLPPFDQFMVYVKGIYERNWLTNNGPLVIELEEKLKAELKVPHLLFLSNGTTALQIAIKALELKGEIITTPFSYIATTSGILWEGCTPVYADIDPFTLNIDPAAIASKITSRTVAILATHVYGNACDIDAIQKIAEANNLKVIYDGAHCFGTKYKGKSILEYGDISTISFHATKIFNTAEGGAVMTSSPELNTKMEFLRNFGHNGPGIFEEVGINGKNSEIHAAFGLAGLPFIGNVAERMKHLSGVYDAELAGVNISKPSITEHCIYNHAYYAVIFPTEYSLLQVFSALEKNEIFARRYFYPSLNRLQFVTPSSMPVAEDISKRVLCLPLYFDLSEKDIIRICNVIRSNCE